MQNQVMQIRLGPRRGGFLHGISCLDAVRVCKNSDMSFPETNNREKNVPDNGQLTIWGRANSVNVQKVLWCLAELDLAYKRIDAGMQFGKNDQPDYLAMNPNGRVPTLVDGDFVLWESNSVMRYLVLAY